MDLLLILTYTAICVTIFKVFKIELNKWTVPTAVLGGVVLIGLLLITMNYNHPYAKYAKEVFVSVPVVPAVKGIVVSVDAQPNVPLKKGDVLFKIDPIPYELQVAALKARLKAAAIDLDRAKELLRKKVGKQRDVDQTTAKVDNLTAQLNSAEYDLERTVVRAPSDGMVTQLVLRPGVMAVPIPLRPSLIFIPSQESLVAASFWQNSLLRMQPGYKAEMIIDAVPGHVFLGKVVTVLPAMSEGEVQASGNLISASRLAAHGRAIAIIELEEDLRDYGLPIGVQGKAAIISDHDILHVSIIRRVLLRMLSWINYVFPMK